MRADPGCQTKVAATPSANIVRDQTDQSCLVPIVYLPLQPPTTFEFIVNPKTAKCPQTTIPASLLARPDAVIECERHLLRCMSLLLARSGPRWSSRRCPLLEQEPTKGTAQANVAL
jgi:hypothetical protein